MGFRDLVRDGVALANSLTADLQANVTHKAWVSTSGSGVKTYAAPVIRPALVDWKQKQVRTVSGVLTVSRASVTFLDPDVIVDEKDVIILPDGTTGPILDMAGFIDRVTGTPYLTEVFLG